MADWIIPCNPHLFDIFRAFDSLETIDWRQSAKSIETGDTVFIYVGSPVRAVPFCCRVLQTMMPSDLVDRSDAKFNLEEDNSEPSDDNKVYMRLKLVRKIPVDAITFQKMQDAGMKGNLQGPRRVPEELTDLFDAALGAEEFDTEKVSVETQVNERVREEFMRQIREKKAELAELDMKREDIRKEIELLEQMLKKL